ncbi:DUF551 domain-containing protein [Escherichia coli]|nr:DUF551 domain-containing protein [Escherichia coli]MHS87451.1 DUF551 domain-containing protein [Escherichia coli]MKZ14442.1 DUF551 domain-containing protein [Escherichia coli]
MSTITREWLKQAINDYESVRDELPFGLDDYQGNILAALRIALASLEAEPAIHRWRRVTSEPYGPYPWHYGDFIGFSNPVDGIEDEYFYSAPPAPVSVPAAMEIDDDFDSAFEHGKAVGWNAYRAAMLQAEPVSNSDELPLDYLQGHKDGLEWAAQQAEANHPQTGDWLYDDPIDLARAIRKGPDMPTVQGGNSPVTPDGWISCSERMPNDAQWCVVDAEDGYYVQCWSEGQGWLGDDISLRNCDVIRWMPIPEPPQEAK